MSYLKQLERQRKLERLRGRTKGRTTARKRSGPTFAQLEPHARQELQRYAQQAGAHWRTDLIADCLRGGTKRRARFADVLCPLVRRHGARWLRRDLRVPWEARRGR